LPRSERRGRRFVPVFVFEACEARAYPAAKSSLVMLPKINV